MSHLTQEERIIAVLDGVLPDEALSMADVQELQRRVFEAITRKISNGHASEHGVLH